MKTVTLSSVNYLGIRHLIALGASAVAANSAKGLISRPYRTKGVYLKTISVVQYDRSYADLGKWLEPTTGGAQ